MTLRDTRTMKERENGTDGLPPVPRLLLCLRKWPPSRSRHRWWSRPRQKQLWSKSPSRNARRPGVRPSHAAARNLNHCEGIAHVPKYRFRVLEQLGRAFFLLLLLFILFFFRYCKQVFCCNPHLYHGRICILVLVALSSNQQCPTRRILPPLLQGLFGNYFFGWMVLCISRRVTVDAPSGS